VSANAAYELRLGDCMDVAIGLPTILSNSVEAMVSDPPAGIGFMGKDWDGDRGGRREWVQWLAGVMRECLRVLKPGAHGLAWALPRTSHWTAMALEDAGFEVRDVVTHHFGTGFPKSLDVSKAIDQAAGAEREVLGPYLTPETGEARTTFAGWDSEERRQPMITAPATEAAKRWAGWGTALKPASEHWILVRKPLSGTVAANVQEHGTGALNIDASRIGTSKNVPASPRSGQDRIFGAYGAQTGEESGHNPNIGRWPANLVLSHATGCEPAGHRTIQANGPLTGNEPSAPAKNVFNDRIRATRAWEPHGNGDGTETIEVWRCVSGCPVADLDAQGDGGARFFFCAKPTRAERDRGCHALPVTSGAEATGREEGAASLSSPRTGAGRGGGARNFHPTVKPVSLMEWLIRLITPPGGLVLDPFAGSGTTGVAAIQRGFRFIGWEREPEYFEIARARIGAASRVPEQLGLLDGIAGDAA
jgi:hypothetical protein